MYISAFPHRDILFELTSRWLSNRPQAGDAMRISRIISYDGFAAWHCLQQTTERIITQLTQAPPVRRTLTTKRHLKDFLSNGRVPDTERIRLLVEEYRRMPSFYYVGSPMIGRIYLSADDAILGLCRFKRAKRIAEKASRYVAAHIEKQILRQSQHLGAANGWGELAPNGLPEEYRTKAERRVMDTVAADGVDLPIQAMTIKDVLGMKIIDTGFGATGLERMLDRMPGLVIVEKEVHSGRYNAIHYVIEVQVDAQAVIAAFRSMEDLSLYIRRGLPGDRLIEDFAGFLDTGLDTVQLDLILTTMDELIESEIGRTMHESRIFKQRREKTFYGNIPLNIEYIIEYLLAVGLSPTQTVETLPITLWGRYLPDTLSYHIRKLYGIPTDALVPFDP